MNGFVQGLPLYVNKDSPVDGFLKKNGAHITTNGYISLKDCVFSGGYSGERYASGIFHLKGASGFMLHQVWRPPRGIPALDNSNTVASSIMLNPASTYDIFYNHLYEGMMCNKKEWRCSSSATEEAMDHSCCANLIQVGVDDTDQGNEPGTKCCARLLQLDEMAGKIAYFGRFLVFDGPFDTHFLF